MQETTHGGHEPFQEKASKESSKGPKVRIPKWGTVNIGDISSSTLLNTSIICINLQHHIRHSVPTNFTASQMHIPETTHGSQEPSQENASKESSQ